MQSGRWPGITMLAVGGPFILVTGQVIPVFQNVLQGHLKLPGQDGVLVVHLKSSKNRWAAALGLLAGSPRLPAGRAWCGPQLSGRNTT